MTALQEALDAIDAERSELQLRLDDLAEAAAVLRRLIGGVEPVVPARVPAGAPVVATKPAKAKPAEGEVTCPEYGTHWKNAQALSVHRARKHGAHSPHPYLAKKRSARAAKQAPAAPALAPVPRINVNEAPAAPRAEDLALRCDRAERTPRRATDLEVAS